MKRTVTLFDPTAPRRAGDEATHAAQPALAALAGKVVGFIDNAKPNFGVLADDLGELLMRKYGVARIVKHRKPSASVPARPHVIAELAAECDVVITGSGD
jgi:hypothetical protein